MDIFITNLHEDTPAISQQFLGDNQTVTQISEVGVDTERPGVAVGFNLLRFAG